MSLPFSILQVVGLVSLSLHSLAQESKQGQSAHIVWSGGEKSPVICVGKPTWFVGVVPESINLEVSPAASINLPEALASATLLHLDPESRLCLFESSVQSNEISPLSFSSREKVVPGAKLQCPTGKGNCASTITGKEWHYRGVNFRSPLLHMRLADPNQHCEPGTPLINSDGELEGIVSTHKTKVENEVFAIPASRISKLVTEIKQHRKSGPVWLGLLFHAESSSPEVMQVKANSPSSVAGIKPGDVIFGVNNHPVEDLNDLVEIIHSLPAEEEATFRLLRGINEKSIVVTPQFAVSDLAENR
ncbi:PDZ domain-containing protein [Verrucomicrobiales bacterium]|nr:PDZ domain-containing protein [Verrucomicrobiales bacterium]|tara:strand:- start:48 stop:956 length:909 start_codon:yes stop_codon:yes gene_type:complete